MSVECASHSGKNKHSEQQLEAEGPRRQAYEDTHMGWRKFYVYWSDGLHMISMLNKI